MCPSTARLESLRDTLHYMKIGFVGGGTGGHFYPLMAVANELAQDTNQPELYYFGPAPYDEAALAQYNITYIYCPAGKLRRYFSIQNFVDIFRNFFGIFIGTLRLFIIYPDVIFSKGGFTSVPILLAARFLRIPVVIHESDAVPGRANKVALKQARYIGIAYDDVAQFFPTEKTALVGIPLRPEILNIPEDPFTTLGIPSDKPLILVTGGSSGAERLNDAILLTLSKLLPHYRIFHQTGSNNAEEMRLTVKSLLKDSPDLQQNYYLEGKVDAATFANLLAAATVVITRAGSTTLFEIAHYGKPSIVIPIPEDISRDQRSNAYAYARTGAAVVIEEGNLTSNLLAEEINTIIIDQGKRTAMSAAAKEIAFPDAAQKIAAILLSIGHEHGS
jgi:UDP-N-acetylglucosamine--N-acetylmuramyl-(pentapeptide) pyrophosphoryl-undecaprenol N-acetylglucosamine transferase